MNQGWDFEKELTELILNIKVDTSDLTTVRDGRELQLSNLQLIDVVCKDVPRPADKATDDELLQYFIAVQNACQCFRDGVGLGKAGSLVVLSGSMRGTRAAYGALPTMIAISRHPELLDEYLDSLRERLRNGLEHYAVKVIGLNLSHPTVLWPDKDISANPVFAQSMSQMGHCVVDRTFYIPYFLQVGAVILLRPRGFGKTYWLNVLEAFFTQSVPFNQLAVGRMAFRVGGQVWNPVNVDHLPEHSFSGFPVLLFDFACMECASPAMLNAAILERCKALGKKYGIAISSDVTNWGIALNTLVRRLSTREDEPCSQNLRCKPTMKAGGLESAYFRPPAVEKGVVVLVDAYDKWLSHFDESDDYDTVRNIMADFLTILKALSSSILLSVVTGVSWYQLTDMISGPNNLMDLTLDPSVSQLFGFTQQEIEMILESRGLPSDHLKNLARNCGGYCFSTGSVQNTLFCPSYVRKELASHQGAEAWYLSSSSFFQDPIGLDLIKRLRLPARVFTSGLFRADPGRTLLDAEGAAFQRGYITIKETIGSGFAHRQILDFPNEAIEESVQHEFLKEEVEKFQAPVGRDDLEYVACLASSSPPDLAEFFGMLNYRLSVNRDGAYGATQFRENYFHKLLHDCIPFIKGMSVVAEKKTKNCSGSKNCKGRQDLVIELDPADLVNPTTSMLNSTTNMLNSTTNMLNPTRLPIRLVVELRVTRPRPDDKKYDDEDDVEEAPDGVDEYWDETSKAVRICERAWPKIHYGDYGMNETYANATRGGKYDVHRVSVVFGRRGREIRYLVFPSGAYVRYGDNDSTTLITRHMTYPARPDFFVDLVYSYLHYERAVKKVSQIHEAEVRNVFLSHKINSLSLMSLKLDHFKEMNFSDSTSEHLVKVLERVGITKALILHCRKPFESLEDVVEFGKLFLGSDQAACAMLDNLFLQAGLEPDEKSFSMGVLLTVRALRDEFLDRFVSKRKLEMGNPATGSVQTQASEPQPKERARSPTQGLQSNVEPVSQFIILEVREDSGSDKTAKRVKTHIT